MKTIVRHLKGLVLMILLGIFFVGILLQVFIALPIVWVIDRIWGPAPVRAQWVNRALITIWLFLLKRGRLLTGGRIKGRPFPGPCIIVSNHPGLFDVLFLIRDIPRLSVLVKNELTRTLPLGPVFKSCGYVLSPDLEKTSPVESLQQAVAVIKAGYRFLLFPEGTRSPVGELHPFKPGLFRIARLAGVPVQPVFIRNHPPFLAKGEKWRYPMYELSHIEIECWDPIPPPEGGNERAWALSLENRYRQALGLPER